MRKLYHSYVSPYARRVLIVLAEKALPFESEKYSFAREFDGLSAVNPTLLLPAFIDGDLHLWGSNLIIEYLLRTYPENSPGGVEPPLAGTPTRPEHHWEDARILDTLETMTDSIMNLRQMKMSGVEPEQVQFLQRQQRRIQTCLDWLDQCAAPEGFAPGMFSLMDINLICSLGNVDHHQSFEWRGRPNLEAILERYQKRPSVKSTVGV